MRIFKRKSDQGPPPELGDDILDLSPFDGSWEKLFASFIDDRHRSLQSASTEELVAFVKDGTLPKGFVVPQYYQRWTLEQAFGYSNHVVSASAQGAVRNALAVAASLDPVQRARYGTFFHLGNGWDVTAVLGLVHGATGRPVSIDDLERVGQRLGWSPSALIEHATAQSYFRHTPDVIGRLPGFSEFVRRNVAAWAAALSVPKAGHEWLWPVIGRVEPDVLELLAEPMCIVATRTPKKVAVAAEAELRKLPVAVAAEHLKAIALSSKPAQRTRAVEVLADLTEGPDREALIAWAGEHLANDRATGVQDAIARLHDAPLQESVRPELPPIDLPAVEDLEHGTEINVRAAEALLAVVNNRSNPHYGWGGIHTLIALAQRSPSTLDTLNRFHFARTMLLVPSQVGPFASQLVALPGLPLPTPLEVSAVAEADGRTETSAIQVVATLRAASREIWSDSEIADFVSFHREACAEVVENRLSSYVFDRDSFYSMLELVSNRPMKLDRTLVAAVAGGYKADREHLYRLVGPDHSDDVLAYLGSKKRAERIGVAEWARHHAPAAAADPLRAAARREKDDGAKAAMLGALEALGEDLDEFLGAEALLADAKNALAKKNAIPKAIEWLDLEALPPLEWSDGSPVAREIVSWFVVMAVKAKSAEPSPILRRHFDNMNPELVRAFGSTVLDTWMAEDLRTFTEDEAQELAKQQAPHHYNWSQKGHGRYTGQTLQQITDALAAEARRQIAGSATTSKGLLAVAAASAGSEVADRVLAYIRKHRGQRVSQAKVLLEMLAWIDEPATVQAVMSVATRFRPKGIQTEAQRQAELLAERHGWTLDDLADRSVPDGGFGADGRLVLDYGERTFTAHLNDDLSIRLVNDSSGKVTRSLPAGRADEDADHIKGIKSDFTAAKKELKTTVKIQPPRLHAAMCVQRTWTPADFRRYFVDHPVMNRLATRLVWMSDTGDTTVTFRPLSDGTLIGVDDDDVVLDPNALVSLAHERRTEPGLGERWQTHLSDYEVAPLFGQFGRPHVAYVEGQTVVADFVGHGHNDGTLRGQMNRQAWQLGVPQDGGVAHEIVKDVPTANLTGVIEILGGLPAAAYDVGSWTCFLGEMYFVASGAQFIDRSFAVPFETVPPVLLTEFYAEAQAIALGGSGFDPDYKKKY